MKKVKITLIVTIAVVTGILCFHFINMRSITQVRIYSVQDTGIVSSVTSSGKIEERIKHDISVEIPAKIKDIKIKEGEKVKKGQPLIELDTSDLEFQLEQTRLVMQRMNKSVTQEKQQSDWMPRGDNDYDLYGIRDVWNEEALYEFANKNDMMLMQQNQIEAAQKKVEMLEKQLQEQPQTLVSPIDGIVTCINAKKGSMVDCFQSVVSVSDLSSLQININVGEYYIADIKEGQRVEITGDAFQDVTYHGIITHISPIAKQIITGQRKDTVVEVIADITETNTVLKPGYSARVRIITATKALALIVPYEAIIQDDQNRDMVYIYNNGRAEKREVFTGAELELETEILTGLKKGEKVILNPPKELKDGDKVRIVER